MTKLVLFAAALLPGVVAASDWQTIHDKAEQLYRLRKYPKALAMVKQAIQVRENAPLKRAKSHELAGDILLAWRKPREAWWEYKSAASAHVLIDRNRLWPPEIFVGNVPQTPEFADLIGKYVHAHILKVVEDLNEYKRIDNGNRILGEQLHDIVHNSEEALLLSTTKPGQTREGLSRFRRQLIRDHQRLLKAAKGTSRNEGTGQHKHDARARMKVHLDTIKGRIKQLANEERLARQKK